MKKIICLALVLILLSSFASCFYKYPAVESTDEEKRTVLTIELDKKYYNVPYEIYRALFLKIKTDIDNGDTGVWTDPQKKDEYRQKADSLVKEKIAEIYAAFYLAEKNGIVDPYSDDVERMIDEYIKIGVEGGVINGEDIKGCDGDYDKYLASLKEMNLNYSAHVLLYRYQIVMSEIYKYYLGERDEILNQNHVGSNLNFTKDDVKAFYDSDNCVRLIPAYLSAEYSNSLSRIEKIHSGILNAKDGGETAVSNYINSQLLTDPMSIKCGLIMGRYSLERGVYAPLTKAAFELDSGGVSDIITVDDGEKGYYVLYKAEKSQDNFDDFYEDIVTVYLNNCVGELYEAAYSSVLCTIEDTLYIKSLDFAEIRMP